MGSRKIRLGDQIQDVTTLTEGIAIGRLESLSGAVFWQLQAPTTDDNISIKSEFIPEAYCKRIGDGVYPAPKRPMGFHAETVV